MLIDFLTVNQLAKSQKTMQLEKHQMYSRLKAETIILVIISGSTTPARYFTWSKNGIHILQGISGRKLFKNIFTLK